MTYLYSTWSLEGFNVIGSDIQIGQICSVVCIWSARAGSQSQKLPTTATFSPQTVRSQCTQNMKLFLDSSILPLVDVAIFVDKFDGVPLELQTQPSTVGVSQLS